MAEFDDSIRRRRADPYAGEARGDRGLSTTERLERLRDGLQRGLRRPGEAPRESGAASAPISAPGSVRASRAVDVESLRGRRDPADAEERRPAEPRRPRRESIAFDDTDPRPLRGESDAEMQDPFDRFGPATRAARPSMYAEPRGRQIDDPFARTEDGAPRRSMRRADPAAEAPEPVEPAPSPASPRGGRAEPEDSSLVRSMLASISVDDPVSDEKEAGRSDRQRRAAARGGALEEPNALDDEADEWSVDAAPARSGRARRTDIEDEPKPIVRPPEGETLRGAGAFSSVERMLAGRYLRARRKEGFISVIALLSLIGIALGVATLIIVMSVMNGFRAELVGKIVGVNGHFTVRTVAEPFRDFDAVAERVRAVPGVTRAAPLIEGQAFASTARNGLGVLVRGVRRSDLLTLENVAVTPEFSLGSLTNFEGDNGVALGQGLALRLGVTVGDTITLISPRGSVTPFGVVPKRRSFEVLYIFKVGMANYDAAVMFMPLEQAQTFFNRNDTVDAVELMVATPEDLSGYREEIAAAAGRSVDLDDWQRANQSLMGALKTERTVMFLILSLLIVIASLIIISGLIMLVKEKGPDIAILRTMGMSRGGVLRVFFMCGATIGVVGTTIGVALGLAFCLNIEAIQGLVEYLANGEVFPDDVYILSKLPAKLHLEDVGFAVGISLGLSFLATLYPAWRAARLDPVEALRYE